METSSQGSTVFGVLSFLLTLDFHQVVLLLPAGSMLFNIWNHVTIGWTLWNYNHAVLYSVGVNFISIVNNIRPHWWLGIRCKAKPSWCWDMTANGSKLEKEPDVPRRMPKRHQFYSHVLFMTQVRLNFLLLGMCFFWMKESWTHLYVHTFWKILHIECVHTLMYGGHRIACGSWLFLPQYESHKLNSDCQSWEKCLFSLSHLAGLKKKLQALKI